MFVFTAEAIAGPFFNALAGEGEVFHLAPRGYSCPFDFGEVIVAGNVTQLLLGPIEVPIGPERACKGISGPDRPMGSYNIL